jgi:hypothetical protein
MMAVLTNHYYILSVTIEMYLMIFNLEPLALVAKAYGDGLPIAATSTIFLKCIDLHISLLRQKYSEIFNFIRCLTRLFKKNEERPQNFALKLPLISFLSQICKFHKRGIEE